MKLIRHILSHSVLIGFITLLVLGFYYRAILFPVSWNQTITQEVSRVAGPYAEKIIAFAAPSTGAIKAEIIAVAPTVDSKADVKPPMLEAVAVPVVAPKVEVAVAEPVDTPKAEVQSEAPAVETKMAEQVAVAPAEEKPAAPVAVAEVEEKPVAPVAIAKIEEKPAAPIVATKVEEKAAAPVVEAKIEEKPAAPIAVATVEEKAAAPVVETKIEEKPATPVAVAKVAETPAAPVAAAPLETITSLPAVTSQPKDEDESIVQSISDQDFVGVNDLWSKARSAYSRGDMKAAVQHYLSLSEQESDNPDVFGELGNVYFAAGRFQQAGQAYYEAAIRLNELGQVEQVQHLVRVIEGLDPHSASRLKQQLVR